MLGKDAWTHILGNGRAIGNTRGTRSLAGSYCVTNTSPQVANKLGLSFSSTKELNDIVDKALPGRPPFETRELAIGGETAGSTPKRGTSVGVERSLSASKPGGMCLISFSSVPPLSFLSVGFPEPCSFLFYAHLNKVKVGVF